MVLHIAPKFPGWVTPTSTTATSNGPDGNGDVQSLTHALFTALIEVVCNPPWVARLVEKEHKTAVLSVRHHQGTFPYVVLLLEALNQSFADSFGLPGRADRLTVPVNPNWHVNTINQSKAGDIEYAVKVIQLATVFG